MGVTRPAPTPLASKASPIVQKRDTSPAKVADSGVADLLRPPRFSVEAIFSANALFWIRCLVRVGRLLVDAL